MRKEKVVRVECVGIEEGKMREVEGRFWILIFVFEINICIAR